MINWPLVRLIVLFAGKENVIVSPFVAVASVRRAVYGDGGGLRLAEQQSRRGDSD